MKRNFDLRTKTLSQIWSQGFGKQFDYLFAIIYHRTKTILLLNTYIVINNRRWNWIFRDNSLGRSAPISNNPITASRERGAVAIHQLLFNFESFLFEVNWIFVESREIFDKYKLSWCWKTIDWTTHLECTGTMYLSLVFVMRTRPFPVFASKKLIVLPLVPVAFHQDIPYFH